MVSCTASEVTRSTNVKELFSFANSFWCFKICQLPSRTLQISSELIFILAFNRHSSYVYLNFLGRIIGYQDFLWFGFKYFTIWVSPSTSCLSDLLLLLLTAVLYEWTPFLLFLICIILVLYELSSLFLFSLLLLPFIELVAKVKCLEYSGKWLFLGGRCLLSYACRITATVKGLENTHCR